MPEGYQEKTGTKTSRKKIRTIFAVCAILAAASVFGVVFFRFQAEKKLQKQLEQGRQYLETQDYEQALVTFYGVLDLRPENADAYLGIVEAKIQEEEFEQAFADAKAGYELSGDERLKEKIDPSSKKFVMRSHKSFKKS